MPKETARGERRVALVPAGVAALRAAGFRAVVVEAGAGAAANFSVGGRMGGCCGRTGGQVGGYSGRCKDAVVGAVWVNFKSGHTAAALALCVLKFYAFRLCVCSLTF